MIIDAFSGKIQMQSLKQFTHVSIEIDEEKTKSFSLIQSMTNILNNQFKSNKQIIVYP